MRLPSLDHLIGNARATAASFPLVLGCAFVAAAAGIIGVDATNEEFWLRLTVSAALGLPLFFAARMASERRGWGASRLQSVRLLGLGLLAAFFVAWPSWSEPVRIERLLQAAIALHLLVAFAPFVGARRLSRSGSGSSLQAPFWDYNKTLFLRFLVSGLYSGVLFIGLAIALAGVDNLLGVDVEGETYARLWLLIAFVFNTWFFLAGTRTVLVDADQPAEYPTGLKLFAQYVLIPLVTVYLTILTLYLGRILLTQTWPSGWIGYLVSSVAVAGILSLLLVHPISDRTENLWVATYARWYYLALVPSIVMLLMAIWKRIDQYGITERRYFLAVLALWLAGIALFYLISRSRNILVIPLTLCLVAVVTFVGPWSAYSVSEGSQIRRLTGILASNDMMEEDRARPATGDVSFEDRREVSAILRYLIQTHGTGAIEPLLGNLAEIDAIVEGQPPSGRHEAEPRARAITEHLGLAYVGRWEGETGMRHLFAERRNEVIPIGDYDYALRWEGWSADTFSVAGTTVGIHVGADSAFVRVTRSTPNGSEEIALPLELLYRRIESSTAIAGRPDVYPASLMRLEGESAGLVVAIYLNSLSVRDAAEGAKPPARFRGRNRAGSDDATAASPPPCWPSRPNAQRSPRSPRTSAARLPPASDRR
jgi:hypothetical protein